MGSDAKALRGFGSPHAGAKKHDARFWRSRALVGDAWIVGNEPGTVSPPRRMGGHAFDAQHGRPADVLGLVFSARRLEPPSVYAQLGAGGGDRLGDDPDVRQRPRAGNDDAGY